MEEGGSGIRGSTVAGGARFFMSFVDECNTESHTWSRGVGEDLPGGNWGAWVFLSSSAPQIPSYAFYQPVLSGATASKVNNFEGMTMSAYTLERWGEIFQVLDAEAQQTHDLSPEGNTISKGEEVKVKKRFVPFIESTPEYLLVNKEGDTMAWIHKRHLRDHQEK